MAMSTRYRDATADAGGALISYLGLVNDKGRELAGGSPAYARQAVRWKKAADGTIRPTGDLTFAVPAGATVAGWRGFSARVKGVDYGGEALTQEAYAGQGVYTLFADGTGIMHEVG